MTTALRTVEEAAEALGISERSMWDLIKNERIATVEIPSARGQGKRSMRRVEQSAIDAFIERHRQNAASA